MVRAGDASVERVVRNGLAKASPRGFFEHVQTEA